MRVLSLFAAAVTALSAAASTASAAAVLNDNAKMYGINYDRRQAPDWDPKQCKTQAQVEADVEAMAKIANSVRIYSLDDRPACHTNHILDAAKKFGVKVALGMWTGKTPESFKAELGRLEGLLQSGAIDSNIAGLHVGSEAILRKEYTAATAIDYLNQVRVVLKKYNSSLKVTVADVVNSYYNNPALLKAVDYASINQFSFWEKCKGNDATTVVLDRLRVLRTQAEALGKEVVISETGWSSGGEDPSGNAGVPSLANQKLFFEEFYRQASAQAIPYYWFVAFESEWQLQLPKNESNPVEGYFGVLNTDRTLKSSFTNLNLKSTPVVTFKSKSGRLLAEAVDPANLRTVTGIALLAETELPTKVKKLQAKWFFDTTSGHIRSLNSDRCLHAHSAANGGKVDTTTCAAGEVKQQWRFNAAAKKLEHVNHKGFCLDYVPSSNFKLHLYKCSSTSVNQDWEVVGLSVTPTPTSKAPTPTTKAPTPTTKAPTPTTKAPTPTTKAPTPTTKAPTPTTKAPTVKPTPTPKTPAPSAPWSAGTVKPPTIVLPPGESQSTSPVTLAVRFVAKQSVTKPFATLVRTGETIGLAYSPATVAGSEWIYDEATKLVRSKDSNYCLDAYEGWDAGRVHVWPCNPAERNQLWHWDAPSGQLRHLTHKGFCLDADQKLNKVQVYGCGAGNNNQVWRKVSSVAAAVRIANSKDSSVVELVNKETLVNKAMAATSDAQLWFWYAAKGTVVSKWNGECLDAYEPKANGRVHTWECIDSEKNQKWKVDGGLLKHATHTGFCLAYTTATNKQLVLKPCAAADATQQFSFANVK